MKLFYGFILLFFAQASLSSKPVEFKESIQMGIPKTLPPPSIYDTEVNHAPKGSLNTQAMFKIRRNT